MSSQTISSLLCGRPVPSENLSTLQFERQGAGYIILHEQHHIKRLDHVMKALAFLLWPFIGSTLLSGQRLYWQARIWK